MTDKTGIDNIYVSESKGCSEISLFHICISGKQAYRGANAIYRLFKFYAQTLGGNTGFCGTDYRVGKCVKWS